MPMRHSFLAASLTSLAVAATVAGAAGTANAQDVHNRTTSAVTTPSATRVTSSPVTAAAPNAVTPNTIYYGGPYGTEAACKVNLAAQLLFRHYGYEDCWFNPGGQGEGEPGWYFIIDK